MLTRREAQYDPVDVTELIDTSATINGRVLVFRGRAEHRWQRSNTPAVVPQRYRELIEEAMATRGVVFAQMFRTLTAQPTGAERAGANQFADPAQEAAARPLGPTT